MRRMGLQGAALRSAATEDGVQPWVLPSSLPYAARFVRVAFFGRPGVLLRCSGPGAGSRSQRRFPGQRRRPTKAADQDGAQ